VHRRDANEAHRDEQNGSAGRQPLDASGIVAKVALGIYGAVEADQKQRQADAGEEDAGDNAAGLQKHSILGHVQTQNGGEIAGAIGGKISVKMMFEGDRRVQRVSEDVDDREENAGASATQRSEDTVTNERIAAGR
jgi:hypothetical protein